MSAASGEALETLKDSVAGPVQWHQYKGTWVGFVGNRVACTIDAMEGMPCEVYAVQMFQGCFTTIEAAKEESAKAIIAALELEKQSKTPKPSIYTTLLKGLVASLEKAEELEARQRQPESPQANAGGKA